MSVLAKLKLFLQEIRAFLIEFLVEYINKSDQEELLREPSRKTLGLVVLYFFQENFSKVCMVAFFLNAIFNGDVISLIFPLS